MSIIIDNKEVLDSQAKSGGVKMDVGIHQNCSLSLEKGDNYVDVIFTNPEGQEINQRIWDWDETKFKTQDGQDRQEMLKDIATRQAAHMAQLNRILLGPDSSSITGSPNEFRDKTYAALKDKVNNAKFNVKVRLDKNSMYTEIGKAPAVEEYKENTPPSIKFTNWEINNRTKRKEITSEETVQSENQTKLW
jgi:hypothetical protein